MFPDDPDPVADLMSCHLPILTSLLPSIAFLLPTAGGPRALAQTPPPNDESVRFVGVTSPASEVELAFPESGIINRIEVEEGDRVVRGQILAKLDSRTQEARLAMARVRAESRARVDSARAKMEMLQRRLEQLEVLAEDGRANPNELAKARSDFEVARAETDLAIEEARTAVLQVELIEAEIERRTLFSPVDGLVARIDRDVSESVTAAETVVMTVVKLDSLRLTAHVESRHAARLREAETVQVQALRGGREAEARVVFVSPVVDPSSSTVRVRLALPNSGGRHLSGEKYEVTLKDRGS